MLRRIDNNWIQNANKGVYALLPYLSGNDDHSGSYSLLNICSQGRFELLFDPYMGSGTSLVRLSLKGSTIGTDFNPLARQFKG